MNTAQILFTILRTYAIMRAIHAQPPAVCIDAAMLAACEAAGPAVPDDLSTLSEGSQDGDDGSSL